MQCNPFGSVYENISHGKVDSKPAVAVQVSMVDADEELTMIAVKQRRVIVLVPGNWTGIMTVPGTWVIVLEPWNWTGIIAVPGTGVIALEPGNWTGSNNATWYWGNSCLLYTSPSPRDS